MRMDWTATAARPACARRRSRPSGISSPRAARMRLPQPQGPGGRTRSWAWRRQRALHRRGRRPRSRSRRSNDLEVALQFPVGHGVEPLAPFPLARGGEVLDEVVAEPVARDPRLAEDTRGLDQRAWRARDLLGSDVRSRDGLRGELPALLDPVEPRGEP